MPRHRRRLDTEARRMRNQARRAIIDAASRLAMDGGRDPYSRRHLQWCVAVCRRRRLVPDGMLTLAGFNP